MPFLRERLKQRRLDMGLTLQEVADQVGVEKPTVQRYESGKISKIDTLTVEKLAKSIRCDPAFLLGWTDQVSQDALMDEKRSSADEEQLLGDYRKLTTQGKEYIRQTMVMALQVYKKDCFVADVETAKEIS